MKNLFLLAFLLPFFSMAQKALIKGQVQDKINGETLVGANVLVADGIGMVTDLDGNFSIEVDAGDYTIKVSYVGYQVFEKKIKASAGTTTTLQFALSGTSLSEIEVIGDVAKTRETPVAFTSIPAIKIQEELASRDIPMMLNKTPGVYATQSGGGEGDSRINIRGFSQRNVAVMFDGIPMNDMENGWVYWSNWFGTDNITRSVQVQRGLGASKLALPAVGGTINILSKGIESKRSLTYKQEFTTNDDFTGSRNNYRSTLSMTSGKLKGGWGITSALSYKTGKGWADMTEMKMYSWFFKTEKYFKNHLLSFTAFGAPQVHAQRADKQNIATYDTEMALKYSIDTSLYVERGARYNANWGYLKRVKGESDTASVENKATSETLNFFHKPVFSVKDFWTLSDRTYWSNVVYASYGNGGGNRSVGPGEDAATGLVDFNSAYQANAYRGIVTVNGERQSSYWIRSSKNNHHWYGFLSTLTHSLTKKLQLTGGVDIRTYKGEHKYEVYDLLGGDYVLNSIDRNSSNTKKYLGNVAGRNFDSQIRWGGVFGLAEYKVGKLTAFLNVSGIYTGYNRIDHLRRKDVIIDGKKYGEVIGYEEMFFVNGEDTLTYQKSGGTSIRSVYWIGDTVHVVRYDATNPTVKDTFSLVNPQTYTINSPEAKSSSSGWKWLPGFTAKGGANYNFNEKLNTYFNIGWLNRPTRFDNVMSRSNKVYTNIKNESIKSVELGSSYLLKGLDVNLNTYYTIWDNKPADRAFTYTDQQGNEFAANINGINALHTGIELALGYKFTKWLSAEASGSLADWQWTSAAEAYAYDDQGNILDSVTMDATGVPVGNAAQTSASFTLRFMPIKSMYISPSYNFFGNQYSEFNPQDLKWSTARQNSWKLPDYYFLDLNLGYGIKLYKIRWDVRVSVINILDALYISDADNNSFGTRESDASSAGVFMGQGRRMNFSLTATF